jgi:putative nucleotidyltransferase with HDIG domain
MGVQSASRTLGGLLSPPEPHTEWIPVYMTGVTLAGLAVIVWACQSIRVDWPNWLLFGFLGVAAEVYSLTLFPGSRDSQFSLSWTIAIAGIVVFGAPAGVLMHMVNGIAATTMTTRHPSDQPGWQGWPGRASYNIGVFVLSAALAGWVYVAAGGHPGHAAQLSNLLPLTLMVVVYAITVLGLLSVASCLQTGRPLLAWWRKELARDISMALTGGVLGGGVLALAYNLIGVLGALVFFLPILSLSYSFRLYTGNMRAVVRKLEDANRNLDEANLGLLEALGAVIDAYDLYTYGHSCQVAVYAAAIAEKTRLTPAEQVAVVKAALIHDIGKVGVKDSIIGKPGPLTEEEFDVVKRHPTIGAEIVAQMPRLRPLAPLVEYHHERWDGKGYPHGLGGRALPLGARVLALADSLDAMCSDRPYRPPRALADIVAEVKACAGHQFDPEVVNAFLRVVDEQGPDFFRNSAATVDHAIRVAGAANAGTVTRYLKKSTVA